MTHTTHVAPEAPAAANTSLDINGIMRLLPHRYPFLLVDRVLEIIPVKRIVAMKNVTINEPFFAGHFPGAPVMPGVLVIEAMAQAGAVLLFSAVEAHSSKDSKLVLFTGIERAKFRRPVVPGDQLRIEVEMRVWRGTAGRMAGMAYVGDKRAAEATISCRLVDRAKAMGGISGEPGEE